VKVGPELWLLITNPALTSLSLWNWWQVKILLAESQDVNSGSRSSRYEWSFTEFTCLGNVHWAIFTDI